MGARQSDVQGELDRLRTAIDELRASRRRLVLAADDDRRAIERDLHGGVHQRLISLAVALQLARQADRSDSAAVTSLLAEMAGEVQNALEETTRLAQRIHPASLEATDLAALLRSAATAADVRATVDVTATGSYPPEAVMTIHLCWLDAIARARRGTRTGIEVHDTADALAFEITQPEVGSTADLDAMRDRVEALGGRITIASSRDGGSVVAGSLSRER